MRVYTHPYDRQGVTRVPIIEINKHTTAERSTEGTIGPHKVFMILISVADYTRSAIQCITLGL